MANDNVNVLASDGVTIKNVKLLDFGRQAAADSKSIALSTEDKTQLDALVTALQIMDDWDESDRAKVNIIAGQAGVTAGAGAVAANTPRVTHASDDPVVTQVGAVNEGAPASDTAASGLNGRLQRIAQRITSLIALVPAALTGSGNFKVAVQEALPTGANTIGAVSLSAAIPAGTNNIGDVDLASAIPAGTNNIGDVDVLTVPADPFGANADAASATGSISAKLRGIATALGVTAFDLGSGTGGSRTLRFFLDTAQWIGGAGAVTSATQRVTLASDDPLVAAVQTEDAAHSTGHKGIMPLSVRQNTAAALSGTDGDYQPLITDGNGRLHVLDPNAALIAALIDGGALKVKTGGNEYETVAASQTTQTLGATGATGDYLEQLIVVVATAATAQVQIKDGGGSAITVFPNNPGGGIGTYNVAVGLKSAAGAWQVTTGAGVSVIATGDFT
jgi:hypothetical protein